MAEKYNREKHCGFGKSIWELDELEDQNWEKKSNDDNGKKSEDQDEW
jgi:hypothetical protein